MRSGGCPLLPAVSLPSLEWYVRVCLRRKNPEAVSRELGLAHVDLTSCLAERSRYLELQPAPRVGCLVLPCLQPAVSEVDNPNSDAQHTS